MKKTSILVLIGIFFLAAGNLYSQKLKSGDLSVLKGQKVINLQYDYSHLKVGKYDNEEEYIQDGIADRNKKKAGSGDEWATKWRSDKSQRFQPKFEESINEEISGCGLSGQPNAMEAQYTLVVHTNSLEQGFQSGIGASKPAYIDLVINLVETKAPEKVIATIDYPKCQSVNMAGYDFDTGTRVLSAFDRAGKNVGKLICKNLK